MDLDQINGAVRDKKKARVLELAMSKIKSLKFATEAAITILCIDDTIKLARVLWRHCCLGRVVAS